MIKPIKADLWSYWGNCDALCVTTNGSIKKSGECIMGRGCALEAAQRFPGVALHLGRKIQQDGHRVCIAPGTTIPLIGIPTALVSFPTKPGDTQIQNVQMLQQVLDRFKTQVRPGQTVQGWMMKSNYELIAKSAAELILLADDNNWRIVVLPIPGCGNGELVQSTVLEVLSNIFDDRFVVVSK